MTKTILPAFYILIWQRYNQKVSYSNYMSKRLFCICADRLHPSLLPLHKNHMSNFKKMYYAKGNVILSIYANRI